MKKSTPQVPPISFQQLVLGAAGLVSFRWRSFVIGALSFALLMAAAATFIDARINLVEQKVASEVGLSADELHDELTAQADRLSEEEFMVSVLQVYKEGLRSDIPVTKDTLFVRYFLRTGPYVFGLLMLNLTILFVCLTYFLSFFSNPIDTAYETAQKLPLLILSMIGLLFWVFLRSWAWLPFVGPFFAIYFTPRYALAPAILASGEGNVFQSARLSLERTKLRWLQVFLYLLGIFLLLLAALWFTIVVAGSVALFLLKAGFFLWLLGLIASIGFASAMMVVMGAGMR